MRLFAVNAGIALALWNKVFTGLALGGGLMLALLWLLGGQSTPVIAAPVLSGVEGPALPLPSRASADFITVCLSGICDYSTVQAAVDAAGNGDEIRVATGLYTDVNGRAGLAQVVYISKTVTIRGGYTTTDWTTSNPISYPTTLDGQGQGRVLYVTGAISPTIEGLRISGGDAYGLGGGPSPAKDAGGGVYVNGAIATINDSQVFGNSADYGGGVYLVSSAARLSGNSVTGNEADNLGGGLYLRYSPATLMSNTVTANSADYGSGLYLNASEATLSGNAVSSNTASSDGGGLYLYESGAILTGNTVTANVASSNGGGLYLYASDATVNENTVIANTASSDGGGLYLYASDAVISGNIIIANTASSDGGGLRLYKSDATLTGNTVTANTANLGGGLYLYQSDQATLNGNAVISNTANYGGGLYLYESNDATLSGNVITSNTANSGGGGLCLYHSDATLTGNTVIANTTDYGGGLYLYRSGATLTGNTVTANTAEWGGGLYLHYYDGLLDRNTISANSADYGGGLAVSSSAARLNGNTITANTAGRGGGLYLYETNATLTNTVVADNQAYESGSGLYLWDASPRLLHTTLARNSGGDGTGVYVLAGSIALTNTILVRHAVGIRVISGATATLESTLWGGGVWVNGTNWNGEGTVHHSNDYYGDPVFVDPDAGDYHIKKDSVAVDKGVEAGVTSDIDGDHRPAGPHSDLGADEWAMADLSPSRKMASPDHAGVGDVLTYTIVLSNSGLVNSINTLLCDTIPTGTTYVSGSAQATSGVITDVDRIRWTGTVTLNQAVTITFRVTVNEQGCIKNTAIVTDQHGTATALIVWVNPRHIYLPYVKREV